MTKCPKCQADNAIVNRCGCDPNNLTTKILPTISLAEYNLIHTDYRGVWSTEREDWPNWENIRHLYMGKRTMSCSDGLAVEGLHFYIV